MLNPGKFGNIFLGIEAFHLEVVLACCVKYLQESGSDSIFVELETFGPGVITSVMAGGNYIYGKREQKIEPLKLLNQLVNAVKIKTNESNEAVSLFKDKYCFSILIYF